MTASTVFALGVTAAGLGLYVWAPIRDVLRGRGQEPPAARARIQENQAIVLLFPRSGQVDNVVPIRSRQNRGQFVEQIINDHHEPSELYVPDPDRAA